MSWTKALKNRFKNMRRIPRSAHTGLHFSPPSKISKGGLNHAWPVSNKGGRSLDSLTYERHKASLKRDYDKKKECSKSAIILMKETSANRREWIQKERPTVSTIITEFPYLKYYSVVSCLYSQGCLSPLICNPLEPS